jgi:nucleoside 2-deoxyribosyltransferase
MKIYLAGAINPKTIEQCKEWRSKIKNHYNNYKGQKYPISAWLDPLNGEEYLDIKINDFENKELKGNTANIILYKDYKSVIAADLIICNTDTFGSERPLIGTLFELAWAWEHHKPVVVIDSNNLLRDYPFTQSFIFYNSVEEMLNKKVINLFFKSWNDSLS